MSTHTGSRNVLYDAIKLRPEWVLALMLLALHAALAWDIDAWWARAMWLSHFGLFLIWQPLWRAPQPLEPVPAVAVIATGAAFAMLLDWWLAALWISVLFALIAGRVPGTGAPRQRLVTLLAALFLLALLLLWVVPRLTVDSPLPDLLIALVQLGLPLLAVAVALIRVGPVARPTPVVVDLIYSVVLLLLVVVLVLGSLVLRSVLGDGNYLAALAQALVAIAVLLVAMSWLWNPRGGFGGLSQLLSWHLLSLGLPFENWMRSLALLAEHQRDPERFLQGAIAELSRLPWVSGVQWTAADSAGTLGVTARHRMELSARGLTLELFTHGTPTPALKLHAALLAQLLGDFYDAKRREQRERKHAYAHAIHETGARLTHDVKNLLQSLQTLCAAVESSDDDRAPALQQLMRRQLPQIAQRLERTLEKLAQPQSRTSTPVPAQRWWDGFRRRVAQDGVELVTQGDLIDAQIPQELFDSAADNLLQNALVKRQLDSSVVVCVELSTLDGVQLSVTDSGVAVDDRLAERLLAEPVASRNGLGVGLYHTAQLAVQHDYELLLTSNQPGAVQFALRSLR
ncbi:MAG: HAMP domain-containing histidine kinase [Proteobacteria bacterium]|nr:HAMP domain-containing histidine kinase [Burkholderiales bacterium]